MALAVAPRPALPPDVRRILAEGLPSSADGLAASAWRPADAGGAPPPWSGWRDTAAVLGWAAARVGAWLWALVLMADVALGLAPDPRGGAIASASAASTAASSLAAAAASDRLQLVHDRLCLIFDLPLPVLSVLETRLPDAPPGAQQQQLLQPLPGELLPPGSSWSIATLLLWLASLVSFAALQRVAQAIALGVVAWGTGLRPVNAAGVAALHASLAPQVDVGTIESGPRRGQRIGLLTPQGQVALLTGELACLGGIWAVGDSAVPSHLPFSQATQSGRRRSLTTACPALRCLRSTTNRRCSSL